MSGGVFSGCRGGWVDIVLLGDTVVLGKWLPCSRLLQGPGLRERGEVTGFEWD